MNRTVKRSASLCRMLALTACVAVAPSIASAQKKAKSGPDQATSPVPRKFGPIEVSHVRTTTWVPETGMVHLEGAVILLYTDPSDGLPTTLEAESVDYDFNQGELKAKGDLTDPLHPISLRLTRQDSVFTGQEIDVNLKDGVGTLKNAAIQSELFRLSGESIELRQGVYIVTHGTYTTCIRRRPDYHITARDIRLEPGKSLKAHNITFYAGPTKLVTLPYYRRSLADSSPGQSLPFTPSYNKHDGLGLHYRDSPVSHANEVLGLDISANLKRAPTGYAAYQKDVQPTLDPSAPSSVLPSLTYPLQGVLEQTSPPTFQDYALDIPEAPRFRRVTLYGVVQNQQFLYNRKYTNLSVSRFPEVGLRFLNLLSADRPEFGVGDEPEQNPASPLKTRNFGFGRGTRPLLDVIASAGAVEEFPTHTAAVRLGLRANLASPQFLLGRRLSARVGLSDWAGVYSSGDAYTLFSPEMELNYAMTRTSRLNAGYSFFTDLGSTPFLFDRRDVRQELRLSYHVEGPIGFGYITKLDIGRSRFYDSEVALTRNFDCMHVGLSYRLRSQSIGIVFSLTPPTRRVRQK